MPGAPDYQRLTATLPSESYGLLSETDTTAVDAGTYLDYVFYSPAGTISRITSAYFNIAAPVGATAGTHQLQIGLPGGGNMTSATSNYSSSLYWDDGFWEVADNLQHPPDTMDQAWWLKAGVVIDAVSGFSVLYTNSTTGGTQSNRIYRLGTTVVNQP